MSQQKTLKFKYLSPEYCVIDFLESDSKMGWDHSVLIKAKKINENPFGSSIPLYRLDLLVQVGSLYEYKEIEYNGNKYFDETGKYLSSNYYVRIHQLLSSRLVYGNCNPNKFYQLATSSRHRDRIFHKQVMNRIENLNT